LVFEVTKTTAGFCFLAISTIKFVPTGFTLPLRAEAELKLNPFIIGKLKNEIRKDIKKYFFMRIDSSIKYLLKTKV